MNPYSLRRSPVISPDRRQDREQACAVADKCFMFRFECLSVYLCAIVRVKAHLACWFRGEAALVIKTEHVRLSALRLCLGAVLLSNERDSVASM